MASAGQAVSGVDEVLRARANARRIKEHYDGTLGVPSGLQSLSHLLAHEKDAVFAGLEKLPCYNKTNVLPPPLATARDPRHRAQPPRHCYPPAPVTMPSFSDQLPTFTPTGTATGALPSSTDPNPWMHATPTPTASHLGTTVDGASSFSEPSPPLPQPLLPLLPLLQQQEQHEHQQEQQEQPEACLGSTMPATAEQQFPLEPGFGPRSGGRVLLPSGFILDPWRWTPTEDLLGQAHVEAVPAISDLAPEAQSYQRLSPHHLQPPLRRGGTATGTGTGSRPPAFVQLQCPESRAGGVSPANPAGSVSGSSSRTSSPTRGLTASGAFSGFGLGQSPQCTAYGSGSGAGSPAGAMFGSVLEPETEEERKYRLAKQRMLSANDLSPQEWARIGAPQDAIDLEKFTARGYSISVDFDRQTLLPQRVARPDIFHISAAEAHRRQMEAYEATLALQATRRAEEEAQQQAAEQERQARSVARWPRYDALGVLQLERTDPPAMPRYLDWYPGGVEGLRQSQSGGAGTTAMTSPRGSRDTSALRTQSESAAGATYGRARGTGAVAARRASANEQYTTRQVDALPGSDPYVYEDLGEDPADNNELPTGAAYGTRPPQRRHHSALAAGSFVLPPRPAGVSDSHYAQMVRQRRKWLNAPAKPTGSVLAASIPAPMSLQYVRPRSSRPWPDGTAAPIPPRVAAEAAAQGAADASSRPASALVTVIHPRGKHGPPRPGDRGHNRGPGRALSATTSSRSAGGGLVSAAAFINAVSAAFPAPKAPRDNSSARHKSEGSGDATQAEVVAALPPPAFTRQSSAVDAQLPPGEPLSGNAASSSIQLTYEPSRNGKRLPWEAREHVAAAAAVGSIQLPMLSNASDAPPPGGPSVATTAVVAAASHRRSSTSMSSVAAGANKATGSGISSRRQSQQQQPQGRWSSSVFGEMLPPEGAVGDGGGEQYAARKFELHNGGIVLDGYMGR